MSVNSVSTVSFFSNDYSLSKIKKSLSHLFEKLKPLPCRCAYSKPTATIEDALKMDLSTTEIKKRKLFALFRSVLTASSLAFGIFATLSCLNPVGSLFLGLTTTVVYGLLCSYNAILAGINLPKLEQALPIFYAFGGPFFPLYEIYQMKP